MCRYWLPDASKQVTVGALAYTAIAEAIENKMSAERMLQRFNATTRQSINELLEQDLIIFPCKV